MTILETAVVFGVVPVAAVAIVTAAVFMSSPRPGIRYRPGQQLAFQPVWYLANPQSPVAHAEAVEGSSQSPLEPGAGQGMLEGGEPDTAEELASGLTDPPGDTAVLSEDPKQLGGTRGTW